MEAKNHLATSTGFQARLATQFLFKNEENYRLSTSGSRLLSSRGYQDSSYIQCRHKWLPEKILSRYLTWYFWYISDICGALEKFSVNFINAVCIQDILVLMVSYQISLQIHFTRQTTFWNMI